jgi:hypothetical protein
MSRSASLLGNALWIALSVATCLYPCLPARDPNGDVFALSRFDFALVYLASPEALWLQWTAGLPMDFWAVRAGALATAIVWLFAFIFAGVVCLGKHHPFETLSNHETRSNESRLAFWGMRLIFGFTLFQAICFLLPWLPTSFFTNVSVSLMVAIPLVACLWRRKLRRSQNHADPSSDKAFVDKADDGSMDQPWKRRVYGLATISCVLLATLHITGSMVPSVDRQVRNQKWINTVHSSEQFRAPHLEQLSQDASFGREKQIGRIDPIAFVSLTLMQKESGNGLQKRDAKSQSLGVSPTYTSLLASKLIHVIVGIAGFLIVWDGVRDQYGRAVATMLLMLILSTPALLELGRLGRIELIATSQFAAIITLLDRRRDDFGRKHWFIVMILAIPLLEWLMSLSSPSSYPSKDHMSATLRFIGFSSLFTVPWVSCWLIGSFTQREAKQLGFIGAGIGIFIALSWIGHTPDRSWIPALSLFVFSAARGIKWLFENQFRSIGLLGWCGVIVISLVNAAYWPTMDNRILAPVEWLVREHWSEYGETLEDMRSRFPLEFRKQLDDGNIAIDSRVLLVGTHDDIDVPVDCITVKPKANLDQKSITNWIQQFDITHVGIVANPDTIDGETTGFDEASEQACRVILEQMVEQGKLRKQSVSLDCFDLTLFKVQR